VAVFQDCIPPYRHGFFHRLLQVSKCRIQVIVTGVDQPGLPSRKFDPAELSRLLNFRMRLPFTSRYFKFELTPIRFLWSGHYDVFILPNDILALHVWLAALLSRVLGPRVCLWGHGFSRPNTVLHVTLRRWLMHLAQAAVFYDERTRQSWIEQGLRPEKLFVACNSLDTVEIGLIKARLTPDELARFRRERNLENKQVLLFSGSLVFRKRLEVFIRAMADVIQTVPEARALIIGNGPLLNELRELTQELNLQSVVTFAGPIYVESTLAKFFLCSKLAVVPAAAGLFIQHAFGYGIPVVVGDVRATHGPEISLVQEGVTGVYFRNEDPSSLASTVIQVLRDESLRSRMSSNALKLVEQHHNLDAMVGGFLQAIEYCLMARRSPVP
jgi:glycosyltransferase involved in cell wall biosynthesis